MLWSKLICLVSSGATAGGEVGREQRAPPPWHFSPGNFCWPSGKRQGNKGKWRRKEGKLKREGGKWKRGKSGNGERTFSFFLFFVLFVLFFVLFLFLFFVFFFFCFSLFKTNEISFGSTKIGIFYREKAFHTGKKFRKCDFAPSEKYSSYASVGTMYLCFYVSDNLIWTLEHGHLHGHSAPPPLLTRKFLLTCQKKRGKEKWRRKEGK